MTKLFYELYLSSLTNFIFNFTNTMLMVAGLFYLVRAFRFLLINHHEYETLKMHLAGSISAPLKEELAEWIKNGDFRENGLAANAINTLDQLADTSLADRDKIMFFEALRNETRTAVPKAIPTLAVLIGFLGTVVGLYYSIIAMPDIFRGSEMSTDQSFQKLVDTMILSLTGMSTAFGTTLVGLINSLILTVGNLLYKIRWDDFENKFHQFLTVKIYPIYITLDKENVAAQVMRAIATSQETMKIIAASNRRLLDSVDNLADNMKVYNQDNEKILNRIVKLVTEFTETQKGSKNAFSQISKMAKQATSSYERVNELLTNAAQDRDAFMAYVQSSRDDIREISTLQHQAYMASGSDMLDRQKQMDEAMQDHMVQSHALFMRHFEEAQAGLLGSQKEFADQQYQSMQQQHEKRIAQLLELHETIMAQIEKIDSEKFDQFKETANKLSKLIEESSDKSRDVINATHEQMSKDLEQLQSILQKLQTHLLDAQKSYDQKAIDMMVKLAGLVQKIAETDHLYLKEVA